MRGGGGGNSQHGASPGLVLCQENPPPCLVDDVAEEAEIGERHRKAVFRRAGALVSRGKPGADGAVRFGGVGLEEMKLGAQELGLRIGQQQEVVQIGKRGNVVEQQGGLAPKLVWGAGGTIRGAGEFVEICEVPGVLAHAVGGARTGQVWCANEWGPGLSGERVT